MDIKKIPEKKKQTDDNSWMYNKKANNAMKKFVKIQKDVKYHCSQIQIINK